MQALIEIRDRMKTIYMTYDIYFRLVLKFILGLVVFFMINTKIGYMARLNMIAIPLMLALLCAFLPINCMVVLSALIAVMHLFGLSMEVAAVTAALLMVMMFLYFVMAPKHGYLLMLTVLLFAFKLPYAVPVITGLVEGPIAAVAIGCGVVAYYCLHFATANYEVLSAKSSNLGDHVKLMIDYLKDCKEVILFIMVFVVVVCVVYIIRRLSINYCWYIAIAAGTLVQLVGFVVGASSIKASISLAYVFVGCIVGGVLALAVQFFVFDMDYSGTRNVQFEDDEYYYYVKAVPKVLSDHAKRENESTEVVMKRKPRPAHAAKAAALKKERPQRPKQAAKAKKSED